MNFSKRFQRSAKQNTMINLPLPENYLIPNIPSYDMETSDFLRVDAWGSLLAEQPFSFTIQDLEAGMLLYTRSGGGNLHTKETSYSITENQILFLDCRQFFTLRAFLLPWDFEIFFLGGRTLSLFCRLLADHSPVMDHPAGVSWKQDLAELFSLSDHPSDKEQLQMHRNLTNILSEYCEYIAFREETAESASLSSASSYPKKNSEYLLLMKNQFDRHYQEDCSLDLLETRTGISKYRLCREFASLYGLPPQKYLTSQRLLQAKKMLLHSDLTIQEISSSIGYENVSHFINVFKKYVGTTPGVFRQMAPEDRSALRSLSE